MPSANHIQYLSLFKEDIREPILIVGSKKYDFDSEDFLKNLSSWGFSRVTGIDIQAGAGVDEVVDICDAENSFIQ